MKKQVDFSTYNNDWYKKDIGASKGKQLIWYYVNIFFFKSSFSVVNRFKIFLLRAFGANIGIGVVIKPCVNIKYPWKLSVGNYSWIGENVWIDNLGVVTIGQSVSISQGAMLLTGNHNFKKITFDLIVGKIVLEDGVWIGAKSIVCPNVHCFSHAVLAVQSVATANLEPYKIYGGNPAVEIRDRVIE